MENHEAFTKWAISKGVKPQGIAAHRFPGRGLGIVATEKHEAGKLILSVPTSALRTPKTVPKSLSSKFSANITVHGLLAADLSLDSTALRAPWRAVLPSMQDFQESMPYLWEPALQAILPPASAALLSNQQVKFSKDWEAVSHAYPALAKDLYTYNWLIVNTRTFYYVIPGTKRPKATDDCMALNPFADYFNHSSFGCDVQYSDQGFEIMTNKAYAVGEEIFISYGNHSNDFLLTEYGFIIPDGMNKWDEVLLDHVILKSLSSEQKDLLDDAGFLGNYVLDKDTVCYRSQVALMMLSVPPRVWQRFLKGEDDGASHQSKFDQTLLKVLVEYAQEAKEAAEFVVLSKIGLDCQRSTLGRRWKEISQFLEAAIKRIQS